MALTAKQENRFLKSDLFSGCDTGDFHTLAQAMLPISLLKGQTLCMEGSLGFLLSGKLEICNLNDVLYDTVAPGGFIGIGEMFSVVSPVVPYTIRAKTNSVLTFLTKSELSALFAAHTRLVENYLVMLANHTQRGVVRMQQFTAATPSMALCLYFLENERQGVIRLPEGFAGLARRLNISRATLYRSLAELEQCGLVTHFEKTVSILDPEQLRAYIHADTEPDVLI